MSTSRRQHTATPAEPSKEDFARHDDKIEVFLNGAPIEVTPAIKVAVQQANEGAPKPLPPEMTISQAADFLDVSPHLIIKLIKRTELPCRMVGKRRRIPIDALLAQREKMFQKALLAAAEMTRLSQEMGLYDLEDRPPESE